MTPKENNSSIFHSWPFGFKNYVLFGIGLLVIIIGYILMYTGGTDSFRSIVLSPMVSGCWILCYYSSIYYDKINIWGGSSTG